MSEVRAQQELPVPEPAPMPEPTPAPAPEPAPPPVETPPVETPPPAAEASFQPSTTRPGLLDAVEPAKLPEAQVFEPYTLPEGVQLGEQEVQAFNQILANGELSKQQLGQTLVDMHLQQLARVEQVQHEVFNRTIDGWREKFFADPEIGGNRQQTSMQQARAIIDAFAGTPEQHAELMRDLMNTGINNNHNFMRLLVNTYKRLQSLTPSLVVAQPPAHPPADGPGRRYPTMVRTS